MPCTTIFNISPGTRCWTMITSLTRLYHHPVTYLRKMSRFIDITGFVIIVILLLPMEPLYSITAILFWVIVRVGQV